MNLPTALIVASALGLVAWQATPSVPSVSPHEPIGSTGPWQVVIAQGLESPCLGWPYAYLVNTLTGEVSLLDGAEEIPMRPRTFADDQAYRKFIEAQNGLWETARKAK